MPRCLHIHSRKQTQLTHFTAAEWSTMWRSRWMVEWAWALRLAPSAKLLFLFFFCPPCISKCQPASTSHTAWGVRPVSCPAAGDSITSFYFFSSQMEGTERMDEKSGGPGRPRYCNDRKQTKHKQMQETPSVSTPVECNNSEGRRCKDINNTKAMQIETQPVQQGNQMKKTQKRAKTQADINSVV